MTPDNWKALISVVAVLGGLLVGGWLGRRRRPRRRGRSQAMSRPESCQCARCLARAFEIHGGLGGVPCRARDLVMHRLAAALAAVLPGAAPDQIEELLSALLACHTENWT